MCLSIESARYGPGLFRVPVHLASHERRRNDTTIGATRNYRVVVLVLVLPLSFACGGIMVMMVSCPPDSSTPPAKDVTLTIGNLTDLTGVASAGFELINLGINDMVDYYNENNLIPGIELKVVTYDGQYDPSRDIPGWEWLREHGADVIFAGAPYSVITLQSRADSDELMLFTTSASLDLFTDPGYLFSLGSIPQYEARTLMKWIAETHWDYEANGPAMIGRSGVELGL